MFKSLWSNWNSIVISCVNQYNHFIKQAFKINFNVELPHGPKIPFLGYYSIEITVPVPEETYTRMFIEVFLIGVKSVSSPCFHQWKN